MPWTMVDPIDWAEGARPFVDVDPSAVGPFYRPHHYIFDPTLPRVAAEPWLDPDDCCQLVAGGHQCTGTLAYHRGNWPRFNP